MRTFLSFCCCICLCGGVAGSTGCFEAAQIVRPHCSVSACQFIQVAPAVEAAVVAVGEGDFEGVVAGGLQVGDADAGFAGLQFGLPAPVAAHFCAGGIHAQVFGGQGVFGIRVNQDEALAVGLQADLLRGLVRHGVPLLCDRGYLKTGTVANVYSRVVCVSPVSLEKKYSMVCWWQKLHSFSLSSAESCGVHCYYAEASVFR